VLLAWGGATSACVVPMFETLGPQAWFDVVTLSALMGLYLAMLLFIVALGACVLGCLPLYMLAQVAGWMLPAGWRHALWALYLCPIIAYTLTTMGSPAWAGQGDAIVWLGGLFAAIPTVVLVAFHLWVVAPLPRTGHRESSKTWPGNEAAKALAMLESPPPMLDKQPGTG
jgi:hypothetical protein